MSILGLLTPDFIYDNIYDIDFDTLKKSGISSLIFDIDNTLVAYTQPEPTDSVVDLMNRLEKSGFKICFISNNKKHRVDLFNRNFRYLSFYDAGKPSTKFLKRAIAEMKTDCKSSAVIGDQLFTDIIAAKRMKMAAILVTPIEPVESAFFKLKRLGEKPFIRRYYKKLNKRSK